MHSEGACYGVKIAVEKADPFKYIENYGSKFLNEQR